MSAPDRRTRFSGLGARSGGAGNASPITISERLVTLVQVTARKDREYDLAAAVKARLGLDLPPAGRMAEAGAYKALWLQPSCWLLQAPVSGGPLLVQELTAELTGLAAVVDQSHGRSVLRLSGAHARDVLARTCRLDLHPRVFPAGQSASTLVGHVSCLVNLVDEASGFDLIVGSTFATWLLDELLAASEAFGWRFERAAGEAAA